MLDMQGVAEDSLTDISIAIFVPLYSRYGSYSLPKVDESRVRYLVELSVNTSQFRAR